MTIEQIKNLLADTAQGNKRLQASQDRTDAQLIELRAAQQKTEAVQQDTKIALQELSAEMQKLAAAQQKTEAIQQDTKIALQELSAEMQKLTVAQQKTEAAQQKTEIAQQKTEAAQQKTEIAQQKTEAAQQELSAEMQKLSAEMQKLSAEMQKLAAAQQKTEAAQQKTEIAQQKTEAAQQKTEIAQQKTEAAQQELSAEMQKLSAEMQKLAVAQQKTEAAQQETAATLQKVIQEYGGFINNQGQQAEDFFIKGLCKQDLQVAGIKFDEIFPRQVRQHGRSYGIEVDALLTNGEYVALLEVKSKVHINDVEAVFNKRIPAFRSFFHDYRDKSLLVLIGGNIFNSDALRKARDYGFICLTPDNQDLHIEAADFREY